MSWKNWERRRGKKKPLTSQTQRPFSSSITAPISVFIDVTFASFGITTRSRAVSSFERKISNWNLRLEIILSRWLRGKKNLDTKWGCLSADWRIIYPFSFSFFRVFIPTKIERVYFIQFWREGQSKKYQSMTKGPYFFSERKKDGDIYFQDGIFEKRVGVESQWIRPYQVEYATSHSESWS